MSRQIIEYSAAACGAGKTEWAIQLMATTRGRYIYCVDRIDEFEARLNRINAASRDASTVPFVTTLKSEPNHPVTQRFPELVQTYEGFNHSIIIMTHAALKLVNHSICDGWTLIIDEDPKLWVSDEISVGPSKPFWEATYHLTPSAIEGYSIIRQHVAGPTYQEMSQDQLTHTIAALHDKIRRAQVTVRLSSWDDLVDRLTYFTIFDVTELANYDRVIILANSFDQLLTYRLIQTTAPEVELRPIQITRDTEWLPRKVLINYVACDHTSTVNYLANTSEGRQIVTRWSKWVDGLVSDTAQHYWCSNKSFTTQVKGHRISPKIAGSNAFSDFTECSILYAAKASTSEARVFEDLASGAISFDDIRRDRELEDIIQIVFRSSLRVPTDQRTVTINLYDHEQAAFLKSYFEAAGFPFDIELVHHDIGAVKTVKKRGPKPSEKTMTPAERAKSYRQRKKELERAIAEKKKKAGV